MQFIGGVATAVKIPEIHTFCFLHMWQRGLARIPAMAMASIELGRVVAVAASMLAVVESVTEVACSNCRSQVEVIMEVAIGGCESRVAVPEVPGGTTGIGSVNSSGNGCVMAAIARCGTGNSNGTSNSKAGRGSSSVGPGNGGSNGKAGGSRTKGSRTLTMGSIVRARGSGSGMHTGSPGIGNGSGSGETAGGGSNDNDGDAGTDGIPGLGSGLRGMGNGGNAAMGGAGSSNAAMGKGLTASCGGNGNEIGRAHV